MGLYPIQQTIVDQLNHYYAHRNPITQNHYYLSGEMGVGKTYMGAQLALDHSHEHGTIIVVPDVVSTKWVEVLNTFKTNQVITLVDHAMTRKQPLISYQPNHITVIPNQLFNRLFDREDRDLKIQVVQQLNQAHQKSIQQIETSFKTQSPTQQKVYNFVQFILSQPFFVYDEIHQARQSKLDCLDALLNTNAFKLLKQADCQNGHLPIQPATQALFLTGTIFNTDRTILNQLLYVTNVKLIQYNSQYQRWYNNQIPDNIAEFLNQIWQYISVSLSLDEVQLNNHNQINQTIAPIQAIDLTQEEKAFYELILAQIHANFPTTSHFVQQQHNLTASKFLDFPQLRPEMAIKKPRRKDMLIGYDQKILLSAALQPIPLAQTKKFQRLLTELKPLTPDQKIVIYAQDQALIDQLVQDLIANDYPASQLPTHLKAADYSQFINTQLQTHQIFVVNPEDITVGVDIDAQVLIWYQLLPDMTAIIQAQRRIYRMNSNHDSTVIFLPYALTYQEELVDAISNAAKNNAATYGVQDRSELAKKTHILLAAIDHQ